MTQKIDSRIHALRTELAQAEAEKRATEVAAQQARERAKATKVAKDRAARDDAQRRFLAQLIGKTVAGVEWRNEYGLDVYVLTFADGSEVRMSASGGDETTSTDFDILTPAEAAKRRRL